MQIRSSIPLMSVLALSFGLAACATNPPEPEVKDQASADMECSVETPIGSLVSKKTCRQKLSTEDRMRIQEEMRQMTRPTGTTAPGAGG